MKVFLMGVRNMEVLELLKEVCCADEDDNINYKPYEHANVIQSIPMSKAVEMVEKDIEEMKEFLIPYHLEAKAQFAVYKLWREKIVVF